MIGRNCCPARRHQCAKHIEAAVIFSPGCFASVGETESKADGYDWTQAGRCYNGPRISRDRHYSAPSTGCGTRTTLMVSARFITCAMS